MEIAKLLVEVKAMLELRPEKVGDEYVMNKQFEEFLKEFKGIEKVVDLIKEDIKLTIAKHFSLVDEKCRKIEGDDKVSIYKRELSKMQIVDEIKAKEFLKYMPDSEKVKQYKKEFKKLPEGLEMVNKGISYGFRA